MKQIRRLKLLFVAAIMTALPLASILGQGTAHAAAVAGETFSGVSTTANAWISGGGTEPACLTAASSSAVDSIPACTGGAVDAPGDGVLRLTRNNNNQNGFAIYNTPVSAAEGLDIEFDMYQYAGSGADGIAFFLVDGAANPTQPGALGGSLGYSQGDNNGTGVVGGYVGIGFDRYGNFSHPDFGNGGPGRYPNSITVRGNEASEYQFVTRAAASGQLAVESGGTRTNSHRHVRVTVSTGNIMTVYVDYMDGEGPQTELSNIDLKTINGANSMPASFKFGFTAGTGGSNNIHEIGGLTVGTLNPYVSLSSPSVSATRGEYVEYSFKASNDAGAEATNDKISVTDTLTPEFKPVSANGDGWLCSINGQVVSCERPGSGANALLPGEDTPDITVKTLVSETANWHATYVHQLTIATESNENPDPEVDGIITVSGLGDVDGYARDVEDAAPNDGDANDDGDADGEQASVTSFVNQVTSKYAVLQSGGACAQNTMVGIAAESANVIADPNYSYPAGLMNFTLDCDAAGDSTTVSQYYYGDYDITRMSVRKYDAATKTYQTVPGATIEKLTIGGELVIKLAYQVTDGGLLDQDGVANGVIVDPAGPAIKAADVSAPDTGLQPQPLLAFYILGALGLAFVAYGVRKAQENQA